MKTSDVIAHFGSQNATARALGISQPSVANWGEYPPEAKQILIERLTKRRLRAEDGAMERLIGLDKLAARAHA